MTLRLWRRKRIAPFVTANLSKSGVSLSLGPRGAHWTIGGQGQRVTVGAPGTGLFVTQTIPTKPQRASLSFGRVLQYIVAWMVIGALALVSYVIIATHYH
jgi:hypothetical protein